MPRDIKLACNLKIISQKEASILKVGAATVKSRYARGEVFKDLNNRLHSVIDEISKVKKTLEDYLEPEQLVKENAEALGQHMKDEWNRWRRRFLPSEYPDPPPGMIRPTRTGFGVPKMSGIYFVWENGNIVYVGQSLNMCQRVRLNHGAILDTDMLSFVPIEKGDLSWAESYYIGILRPKRNFKGHTKTSTAYYGAAKKEKIVENKPYTESML